MGRYVYRIAIYGPKVKGKPRLLVAQQRRLRWAYSDVSMGTLLNSTSDTAVVGGQAFQYVWWGYGNGATQFQQTHSTCRSISLDIAVRDDGYPANQFTIYHQSTDPTTATIDPDTIGSLDSILQRGQSWVLKAEDTGGNLFYLNGSASCFSTRQFQ